MKGFFLCTILLLAESVSCGPVKEEKINLPEWLPEINLPDINLPDINLPDINLPEITRPEWPENWPTIPEIIDTIPEIIANLPTWPDLIESWPGIELPDWFPDLDDIQLPEWWPPALPDNINQAIPGIRSSIEDLPAIVQVEFGSGPIWAQGCVGTIITNYHILSAGQCFSGSLGVNNMKAILVCTVLLLAGSVSCGLAKEEKINLPEWLPEINLPDVDLPDINLPDINWPENWPSIPEIVENLPEIIENLPEWPENWPTIPEIIDNIPEIVGNWPSLPEIIANWPDFEFPDWFPDLDDIQLPEWWPPSIPDWWPPALPELPDIDINEAVPGTLTSVVEFPGIVQVEVGSGPIWAQGCAGSVLTNYHVLSAAKCFSGKSYSSRFRRVRAGSSTRYYDGYLAGVDYSIINPQGDLAVVRLSSVLYFSDKIQRSLIIPQGYVINSGLPVTLVGWGSTAQGALKADRDLYKISLNVVDRNTCADKWAKLPGNIFDVSNDKLCVGTLETGGRDADICDIGAPVYYTDIMVGVVSHGIRIGNHDFPVVTTDVAAYTNWIVENAV